MLLTVTLSPSSVPDPIVAGDVDALVGLAGAPDVLAVAVLDEAVDDVEARAAHLAGRGLRRGPPEVHVGDQHVLEVGHR